MWTRMRALRVMAAITLLLMAAAGCAPNQETDSRSSDRVQAPSATEGEPSSVGEEEPAPEADKGETEGEVLLYFADTGATKVVPESRELDLDVGEEAALRALIGGPKRKDRFPTIPPQTKLLGFRAESGTATVDFSRELIEGQAGGSSGELMTVASVVTTLVQFPGIEKVRFLVEGKAVDTLSGHLDLSKPIEPDPSWVGK